nr:MAG TPA: anaerobic ribonucleoside triphosphate reductase [Caudoviricetes sp.]
MYMQIIKKDGRLVDFNGVKIVEAIRKSADRVMVELTGIEEEIVCKEAYDMCAAYGEQVPVVEVHKFVENALLTINPKVAESYRSYRNYKTDMVQTFDKFYKQAQTILYQGDKENSNADSSLASTKQSLIRGYISKELYQRFFLTPEEVQACEDGAIYVHDQRDRLFGMNCCLADITNIMSGGFEMGNLWYNEPKTLDVAFDVLGDIIMSMASQEYGGYTVPEVDRILEPYCEKSFNLYVKEYKRIVSQTKGDNSLLDIAIKAEKYAIDKIKHDLRQGFQGLEMKLNSVASSRGDYIFTTFSFGLNESEFGQMISEAILEVRKTGQGKEGYKKPVLFPKLTFLYTDKLHGVGKPLEHLFNKAIECSAKAMYPDYISLDNAERNHLADLYHNWGGVTSAMGK